MKYRIFYLIWLLPAYMLFIIIQQGFVYTGTIDTYENGQSIAADVLDFDIKQIAAQSNGYVVIRFPDPTREIQERKLSLSVQMAQRIIDTAVIPIRYKADSFQDIVMIPTYDLQKSTSLINMVIAFIGFLVLIFASFLASRYATKKLKVGEPELVIERVD
ncbi:MAG: hypothetical protein ED557_03800 [Balneola sp.]|nr:MAG: hypothetical protein ED557_03800 [Balneola sp.]